MDRQPVARTRRNRIGLVLALALVLGIILVTLVWAGGSEFDGLTSVITISNQAATQALTVTIGCWMRWETLGEGSAGRMFLHGTAYTLLMQAAPDRIQFSAQGWTTAGVWRMTAPASGTWSHVAAAYDAGSLSNLPAMYLNGLSQTVSTAASPAGSFVHGTAATLLGNTAAGDRTFDGQLAECVYYNRLLSANEVKSVALAGPLSVPRGLILYMPLGVFGALNYTATAGLNGTATAVSTSTVPGPPISYASQGEN